MKKRSIVALVLAVIILFGFSIDGSAKTLYVSTSCNRKGILNEEEIPTITAEVGDSIPLGAPLDQWKEWGKDDKTPLFKYNNPENWDKVYRLKGGDFVVLEGEYLMRISLIGREGPVWSYCQTPEFGGEVIGVTDNYFIIQNDEGTFAITDEACIPFDEISEEEKASMKEASKVEVEFTDRVTIDRWLDGKITYNVSDDHSYVDILFTGYERGVDTTLYLWEETWYQLESSEHMYFIQTDIDPIAKTAGFIVNMDGIEKLLLIRFDGDFFDANEFGIVYIRDGIKYFKSYYPINVDGYEVFPEIPVSAFYYGIEFPMVKNLKEYDNSISAERNAPF